MCLCYIQFSSLAYLCILPNVYNRDISKAISQKKVVYISSVHKQFDPNLQVPAGWVLGHIGFLPGRGLSQSPLPHPPCGTMRL